MNQLLEKKVESEVPEQAQSWVTSSEARYDGDAIVKKTVVNFTMSDGTHQEKEFFDKV